MTEHVLSFAVIILLAIILTGCSVSVSSGDGQITAVASPNGALPTPNEDGTYPPMTIVVSNPEPSIFVITTPTPSTTPTYSPTPKPKPTYTTKPAPTPDGPLYLIFCSVIGNNLADVANVGSDLIACQSRHSIWLNDILNQYTVQKRNYVPVSFKEMPDALRRSTMRTVLGNSYVYNEMLSEIEEGRFVAIKMPEYVPPEY